MSASLGYRRLPCENLRVEHSCMRVRVCMCVCAHAHAYFCLGEAGREREGGRGSWRGYRVSNPGEAQPLRPVGAGGVRASGWAGNFSGECCINSGSRQSCVGPRLMGFPSLRTRAVGSSLQDLAHHCVPVHIWATHGLQCVNGTSG